MNTPYGPTNATKAPTPTQAHRLAKRFRKAFDGLSPMQVDKIRTGYLTRTDLDNIGRAGHRTR